MCGIFGVCGLNGRQVNIRNLMSSLQSIQHRGPDDEGYFFSNSVNGNTVACSGPDSAPGCDLPRIEHYLDDQFDLALGFRRLSILDLSPAGHQPMHSADGTLWIIFNGEIYNYIELRAELAAKGYQFHTQSDTEVILNSYREWGTACLEHFNGMWAFALYDTNKGRLFCARDRFGIKPFYYFSSRDEFVFGSEIKALLRYAAADRKANNAVVHDYLAYGLLDHTDETFFEGFKQLPPAHYLVFQKDSLQIHRYWDLDLHDRLELGSGSLAGEKYSQRFYELFEDAIRLHLRSDVTIGSCLSGGLDSSSIVCVVNKLLFDGQLPAAELIGRKQKTFSSCFADPRFDERKYIESVLSVTSAEANYVFPTPGELLDELPKLIWHQDEPFGSTSIYAQWCVMKTAAQRGVRVLLDGQGGDEILAGYHTFFDAYWAGLARGMHLNVLVREWSAYRQLFNVSIPHLFLHTLFPLTPSVFQRRVRSARGSMGMNPDFSNQFMHRDPARNMAFSHNSLSQRLYLLATRTSLPGLLHYEDRNSMAYSIEARVPFLDYRLVEYMFSIPDEQKIKLGYTKSVLRNSMKGILPENIRLRTDKMGFVTPEHGWFSNELRPWFDDIVHSSSFRSSEYFDYAEVEKLTGEHYSGERDLGFMMWRWVNIDCWLNLMLKPAANG